VTRRPGSGRTAPDRVAVDNFLASLGGLTAQAAFANSRQDARAYGWNAATVDAVARGISEHFIGRKAS
jgi:hypothetical protein